MSGFGITSLRRVKEESHHKEMGNQFYSHIVVGNNFSSILKLIELQKEFGEQSVRIITDRPLDKASLEHEWKCTLFPLRSREEADKYIGLNPRLEIIPFGQEPQFYKDGKLYPFNGRAKPYTLLAGEEKYQELSYKWSWENFFDAQTWEDLDGLLADAQIHKIIQTVEVSDPTDMLRPSRYKLHTGEWECIECENLYWGREADAFLSVLENKDKLSDEEISRLSLIESSTGLVVSFECDQEIYETEGVIYLPQSMTHDWGHFIAEFRSFDPVLNTQEFKVLILINEDELTAEELAKKIRLMKRVVERVFPHFAKCQYQERIRYASSDLNVLKL